MQPLVYSEGFARGFVYNMSIHDVRIFNLIEIASCNDLKVVKHITLV